MSMCAQLIRAFLFIHSSVSMSANAISHFVIKTLNETLASLFSPQLDNLVRIGDRASLRGISYSSGNHLGRVQCAFKQSVREFVSGFDCTRSNMRSSPVAPHTYYVFCSAFGSPSRIERNHELRSVGI